MKEFQLQPFIVKNNSIYLFFNWKVIRYLFFFTLMALSVSYLSVINFSTSPIFIAVRIIQFTLFIALGIIHSESLDKRSFFTHHSNKEKFYFTLVLTLVIYAALLLFYFTVQSDMQRMAVASSCAFILPYLIVQAWNYFLLLADDGAMVWTGYKKVEANVDIVYLNSILIRVRLLKRCGDKEDSPYSINSPLNIELGKLFNSFLNVENKDGNDSEIECIATDNKPFGWKFYAVSYGGLYKRILNPAESLQNNRNIKRNTTILAVRV